MSKVDISITMHIWKLHPNRPKIYIYKSKQKYKDTLNTNFSKLAIN